MNRFFIILCAAVLLSSCTKPADMSIALEKTLDKYVPDKRVSIFELEVSKKGNALIVNGVVSNKEAHKFFIQELQNTNSNYTIADYSRQLPDTAVGANTWALVHLSVAPMRAEPSFSSEMVSQAIMGTPIKLLDKDGDWYRVQTPDAYIGWINQTGFTVLSDSEYEEWKSDQNRAIISSPMTWAYERPDNSSQHVSDLVQFVILNKLSEQGGYVKAALPDGRVAYVNRAACVDFSSWNKGASLTDTLHADLLIKEAKSLLGSPYLWGGTSTKGMDCSGFTKTIFFSQAWLLERDASQQAKYGKSVEYANLDNLKPGDLLFFGRNKKHITHVGMYIGDDHFIHCAGRVKINSLNPDDSDYNEKRRKTLVLAKRMLPQGDELPIKSVKSSEYSWYVN